MKRYTLNGCVCLNVSYKQCTHSLFAHYCVQVSPVYHAALRALSSVGKNDIMELMGYREPPDLLKPVFDALCMLFDREQT